MPAGLKRCPKCGAIKPLGEFYRDRCRRDGLCGQCKECMNAYDREKRLADPGKANERAREWARERDQDAAREKASKYRRRYQATLKGQRTLRKARWARRARQALAPGKFTAIEFASLCHAVGDRCLCCGEHVLLVPDHVVPLSKGGSNGIDNIQPLCALCNDRKNDRGWDFRVGFEATR